MSDLPTASNVVRYERCRVTREFIPRDSLLNIARSNDGQKIFLRPKRLSASSGASALASALPFALYASI